MIVNKKIAQIAFKCRGLFWGVFAAGVLVFSSSFDRYRFVFGLIIMLLGQALRFWAAGYIPKYRTEIIDAPVLVTWGPYKWIRNPLYAGNAVMGLGWALMVGWYWVAAFVLAFVLLYSMIIIPAEEEFLESKFGDSYREYKKAVPQLIPYPRAGWPGRSEKERPFDKGSAWAEEIYSMRMNFLVTAAIILRLKFMT